MRYLLITMKYIIESLTVQAYSSFDKIVIISKVQVFDDILSTSTQSKRSWAVFGCDALPYTIGHRVLENVHSCPSCHYEFLSEEELVDHAKTSKHDCDSKLCRKYKHIMLVPGIYCYF